LKKTLKDVEVGERKLRSKIEEYQRMNEYK
jgi:hypothetical protein